MTLYIGLNHLFNWLIRQSVEEGTHEGLEKGFGGSTVVAFATVLALAGCGGSAAPTDAPAGDAAATEEAAETKDAATLKAEENRAKAEKAKHWRVSEEVVESTNTYTFTQEDGSAREETGTTTRTTTYEFDDKGNAVKKTVKDIHDWSDSTNTTETVTTYTREDNGWPTKAETVTTSSYTYSDGNGGTAEHSDDPETTEVTYTYDYDDDGRVTKVTSDDEDNGDFEFTYNEDGNQTSVQLESGDYSSDYTYTNAYFEEISDYQELFEYVQYWMEK